MHRLGFMDAKLCPDELYRFVSGGATFGAISNTFLAPAVTPDSPNMELLRFVEKFVRSMIGGCSVANPAIVPGVRELDAWRSFYFPGYCVDIRHTSLEKAVAERWGNWKNNLLVEARWHQRVIDGCLRVRPGSRATKKLIDGLLACDPHPVAEFGPRDKQDYIRGCAVNCAPYGRAICNALRVELDIDAELGEIIPEQIKMF